LVFFATRYREARHHRCKKQTTRVRNDEDDEAFTFAVADNSINQAGAVYVFRRSGTTWSQQAYVKALNTGANDRFGGSVTLAGDGATLVVRARGERSDAGGIGGDQSNNAAANSGAVYLY
jgi:hypothetical protein